MILLGGVIPLIQQGLICVLLFSDVAEDEHGKCSKYSIRDVSVIRSV